MRNDQEAAGSSRAQSRNAYVFNTIGGLLMAFQSVILLVVITRVTDIAQAGIFTFAYANANLFLNAGRFGMRPFQASDTSGHFGFAEYAGSRVATSCLMIVSFSLWLAISAVVLGYSAEKTAIILLMCLFKLIDAVEDVFHAEYQRKGRLDLAALMLSLRLVATLAVFVFALLIYSRLLESLAIATVFSALMFLASVWYVRVFHGMPGGFHMSIDLKAISRLLWECLPLFVASFLLFYICNAPRYAIDATMSDEAQAIFGFLAMPVYMVGLLSSFVYNPMITRLAQAWDNGDYGAVSSETRKQTLLTAAIAAACVLLAALLGVPVLNLLYNTDVGAHLTELLILVAAGAFNGLIGLYTTLITIIRRQQHLIISYLAVSLAALLLSPFVVGSFGIIGAAAEYFVLTCVLALVFFITLKLDMRHAVEGGRSA
jgi:O-antigen/teichoic acid export membrane protein